MRPDGLGAFGIPCGSYIFLNSPTHQRDDLHPFGREDLQYVQLANESLPEFAICQFPASFWITCPFAFLWDWPTQPKDRMQNGTGSIDITLPSRIHICGTATEF